MNNLLNALQGGTGFGVEGVIVSSGTVAPEDFTGSNAIPMDIMAKVPGAAGNGLDVEMSRNDMFTFTQVDTGINATQATKGDVRVRTDENGTIWFYVASEDISTPSSQAWRATQLGAY